MGGDLKQTKLMLEGLHIPYNLEAHWDPQGELEEVACSWDTWPTLLNWVGGCWDENEKPCPKSSCLTPVWLLLSCMYVTSYAAFSFIISCKILRNWDSVCAALACLSCLLHFRVNWTLDKNEIQSKGSLTGAAVEKRGDIHPCFRPVCVCLRVLLHTCVGVAGRLRCRPVVRLADVFQGQALKQSLSFFWILTQTGGTLLWDLLETRLCPKTSLSLTETLLTPLTHPNTDL